jgi:hypothetical protein
MKLNETMKRSAPVDFSEIDSGFDSVLDRLARKMTGHGPGHPAYEAIVHPPKRGRPPKGAKRASVLTNVRLPLPLMSALRLKAAKRHLPVAAAIREAVVAWMVF